AAETSEDQRLEPEPESAEEAGFEFDVERIVARHQGRKGWTREAHRQLEQRRWDQPDPVPRAREDRLFSRVSASRPSATPRSRPTGRMRITGRRAGTRKAGGSLADRSRGSHPRFPRGW